MAKIRGFKPELWTDDDFVELSAFARLLWMGMWNFACDNGHLQDKSKQLKGRVLPMDDVNCADLLREIEAQGLIVRNEGWITIPKLTHHQKPHKRWWVTCEKPDCKLPEGASYGYSKPTTTVEQPLSNGGSTGDNGWSTADGDVEVDGELKVMVSSPGELALTDASRTDVDEICDHLAGAIEANGSKRPTVTARWRTAARLMLDKDGRTQEEIHGAIDWCQRDEFWRANVLSLPTLREKYDQLRLQAQRKGRPTKQQETDDLFARNAARMGIGGVL